MIEKMAQAILAPVPISRRVARSTQIRITAIGCKKQTSISRSFFICPIYPDFPYNPRPPAPLAASSHAVRGSGPSGRDNGGMSSLTFSGAVVIARSPEDVYDLVSDVTRTGEWSPVCRACWWDEGDGPQPGAWFTGRNEQGDRTWETRSQVTAAERGKEFTFLVGGAWVRWSYQLEAVPGGTRLTEEWEFLPAGLERFRRTYGAGAQAQVEQRTATAHEGIPQTLAAIKRVAESG